MKVNKLAFLLMPALTFSSLNTHAGDIRWNGFMSIVAGTTLDDDTTYLVDPNTGGTYDDTLQFAPESVVGLQASTQVNEKLTATVQIVAKGGNDYSADVEWAFFNYSVTPDLSVGAGRFRLPFFYYSDFLDVGYAYHWVRPPVDVYNLDITIVDGVNSRYSRVLSSGLGDFEIDIHGWYGSRDLPSGDDTIAVRKNLGLSAVVGWEWVKLRRLYHSTEVEFSEDFPPFALKYHSTAILIDYNNFFLHSEFTELVPEGGDSTTSWYSSGGYVIGDFTPHYTISNNDVPPGFGPATVTDSSTLGVAWDFSPSAKLKVEYVDRTVDSGGIESEVSLVAVAVDFVF